MKGVRTGWVALCGKALVTTNERVTLMQDTFHSESLENQSK
jgi:hypothetical protein